MSTGLTVMETARTLNTTDGITIAYRRWSSGPHARAIVLIHGMASNLTRWSEFVDNTHLKHTWDILRLDLRGHAASMSRGPLGLAQWSSDIAQMLEKEGYAQALLIGHCLGANIALHFAGRYPQKTAGLVLVEPMFREALTGKLALTLALRPLLRAAVHLAGWLNRSGIQRHRFPSLDLQQLDRQTRAAMATHGSSAPMVRRYAAPWQDLRYLPTANYLQALLAVSEELSGLEHLNAPVLALLSAGSTFSEPHRTQQRLQSLPRCQVVTLDAHHWIPAEKPDAMRNAIEQWCAERYS